MSEIVLLECSAPHWIDVMTRVAKEGHAISHWSAWKHSEAAIRLNFPNCVFHDTLNAKRGILSEYTTRHEAEFDEVCQSIWIEEAQIVFDMMNRFDYSRDLNNVERNNLFLSCLVGWRGIITSAVDLIVFPAPPHVVYDYIALCIARRLGVQTIMFEEATVVPPYRLEMRDFVEGDLRLREGLRKVTSVSQEARSLADKLRGSYERAQPVREIEAQKRMHDARVSGLEGILNQINQIFSDEKKRGGTNTPEQKIVNTSSLVKERGKSLKRSFEGSYANTRYMIQRYEECAHTFELYNLYQKLCSNLSELVGPFVFLPLAGQPERTSNPQAGIFANQMIMAKMISNSLPEGWSLVIKEHPNQFHPEFAVNMCRSMEYYLELAVTPQIHFVDTNTDPFDLIDKCSAVATTGGTAGLEAVARGKPTVLFGDAWYRDCPGVFRVRDLAEVKKFFEAPPLVSEDGFGLFIQAVLSTCKKGMADYPPADWPMDESENIENLTQSILDCLRR